MRRARLCHVARRFRLLTLITFASFAFLTLDASYARQEQAKDARYYEQQALGAYRRKDYAAFLEHMKAANALRPNHPRLTYNLAAAHALNGQRDEALHALGRLAAMGLVFPAARDEDFDSLKGSSEFEGVVKKFQSNGAPLVNSATAFTIREKGLVPESVAYDPVRATFYVGSVYKRKILRVGRDGEVAEFAAAREGLWSAMGMKVDAKRRHLWVATAAHAQMSNYEPEHDGESAILKFDLETGKLLKRYALSNKPAAHLLGDLVVSSRGDVFATDSLSPAIYVIRRGRDELETLAAGGPYVSPQGLALAFDESRLYVADYSKGVFVLDARTGESRLLAQGDGMTLLGLDGLYYYRGALLGVQNGINPPRLVRLSLDRAGGRVERLEVIEANHPLYDEPTLGVVVKDAFYYIANSQWGAIDKAGQLAPTEKLQYPVVLRVNLATVFKDRGRVTRNGTN